VCKAHRLLYHSTLGLRVMKKKKNNSEPELLCHVPLFPKCEEGTTSKFFKTFALKMAQAEAMTGLFFRRILVYLVIYDSR